ncbi:hypothetical protein EDB89DRAFT_1908069 [Lactarius sanguifluus]|nr:hypothetical protein EDB89DRAFT_1908069 [Lactarius sanguifluus]
MCRAAPRRRTISRSIDTSRSVRWCISKCVDGLRVNVDDFANALEEMIARRTVSYTTTTLSTNHCAQTTSIELGVCVFYASESRGLLHGPAVTGKIALAATIAQASGFPFIKLIAPDNVIGFSEAQKVQVISKVFVDSSKARWSSGSGQHRASLGSGTCGPALLQCGTALADPHGAHGRASPREPPPSCHCDNLAPPDPDRLRPYLIRRGVARVSDRALEAVELFHSTCDLGHADAWLRIGIKRLLGVVEMARQDSQAVASPLMGFGM